MTGAGWRAVLLRSTLLTHPLKSSEPFVDFYFTSLFIESCDYFLLCHSCNISCIKSPL